MCVFVCVKVRTDTYRGFRSVLGFVDYDCTLTVLSLADWLIPIVSMRGKNRLWLHIQSLLFVEYFYTVHIQIDKTINVIINVRI